MKRIFIAGHTNSGATLLQSMLGNAQEVFNLPENHFFSKTIPRLRILRYFSPVIYSHKKLVKKYLEKSSYQHLYREYAKSKYNLDHWSNYLIQMIDSIAEHETLQIILTCNYINKRLYS